MINLREYSLIGHYSDNKKSKKKKNKKIEFESV